MQDTSNTSTLTPPSPLAPVHDRPAMWAGHVYCHAADIASPLVVDVWDLDGNEATYALPYGPLVRDAVRLELQRATNDVARLGGMIRLTVLDGVIYTADRCSARFTVEAPR